LKPFCVAGERHSPLRILYFSPDQGRCHRTKGQPVSAKGTPEAPNSFSFLKRRETNQAHPGNFLKRVICFDFKNKTKQLYSLANSEAGFWQPRGQNLTHDFQQGGRAEVKEGKFSIVNVQFLVVVPVLL
jgi:hypothetical protein